MGVCTLPFTLLGCGKPAASRIVGATSMTCENWRRMPPFCWTPFGQWMTVPLRVPPKSEATCLVHWKGVSKATAQPAAMCGNVSGPPHSSMRGIRSSTFSVTPLK